MSVMSRSLAFLVCCVLCLPGQAAASPKVQPEGWDAQARLTAPVDLSPDPHVLEIDLDARLADVEFAPGERAQLWTYGGVLPGPLIRARLGDRLIVHFTNRLPAPTTIHWHGLRVPPAMDGVPEHSQPEVAPGGTFTYDFVLRDAGLFWYHPHVMSAAQVGFGLYGALLVDDPSDGVAVDDELVLVLSDVAVTDGVLDPPESGGSTGMAFGLEGNRVLVNGRTDSRLKVREGAPQRWRLVNAAKSRYFLLDLEGETFTTIGVDGGLIEYPKRSNTLVIAPGERLDVLVSPKRPARGPALVLRSGLFNRGYGSVEYRSVEDLLTLEFDGAPPYKGSLPAYAGRRVAKASTAGATQVHIDLTLAQRDDGKFEYGIDGLPFAHGHMLRAHIGETQVWTITNKTKWSHPFHLHGFFFQVLGTDGQPMRPLAWKDTVDVPFDETVRIVVTFDERPGMWMYHCHILDHADGGLMGMLELSPAAGSPIETHGDSQAP